ncbi:sigma-70 family RNA polymerase sigma factor [Sediminibacillus dalangtanensis]|uniref:Sigma-70 family RNA polymerase sigma factor n=1 Tax=Sediminibacillus dalangtanensis TaxID=2729421 RepID=A0ABX7VTG2_9BACI|nr:sigma-70 family RNA polymerase sigma factor [Sediminibacillus dalangtanensis]QTM98758.1 sigma-70 family RNA polymerase sigma factor [Sediminibacillus dalangtanensis]
MEEYTAEDVIEDREEIIDQLMQDYGQDILQLAFSYVKDKGAAEDLTQEIFIKCYKKLHTYDGKSKLKTWLWRIAINHCKDYLKSWYIRNVFTDGSDNFQKSTSPDDVEKTVIQKSEDQQLMGAVMELPVKYREVIYLFYYEDLPLNEVSIVTGKNVNTVKTRLRKAKKLLRKKLGG